MHCIKKITEDLTWVGANDRRLAMFEGVYSVPNGVSYNSYLLNDKKTVLFDTVDKAVKQRFLENLEEALQGRDLDYLIVQHMEPDHSASLMDLVVLYPNMKIVCNEQTLKFIKQFNHFEADSRVIVVNEFDILDTGKHKLHFLMAPMVHWPEVMVTYDSTDKILFSADAFGCFGALNGAIFADEVDFFKDYIDEARRYYANIVGKYGPQVQALLTKASDFKIEMICPLHGFVWRKNIHKFIDKYILWSSYTPEEQGVMIAYASVYGNTENAAEILACRLRDNGIKTVMFDVSVTPASYIISAAFRYSHFVFASITYNAGIFVTMEALINDLIAHNIQNRTIAIIENGSWAPESGSLIRKKFEACKNIEIIDGMLTIKSSLDRNQLLEIDALAAEIALNMERTIEDDKTMFKLSYGLFVVSVKDGEKDNGCIINTVMQITEKNNRISFSINKDTLTHDLVMKTKELNISILSESVPFSIFESFGFKSGRDVEKFVNFEDKRTNNGIRYLPVHCNGVISAKVTESFDYETHTLFVADVTEAMTLSDEASVTYQYYFDHIKPKPVKLGNNQKGFVCKICGFVHEGDNLPADIICPLCKHGFDAFETL
ncbi:MAG: flavin reductase [Erysipelotrichales bacterium]|nr:flavin reductase [Erysipelotrichales bacterium]